MIRLDLNRKDHWLELCPGVRVQVHPMSSAILMSAKFDDIVVAAQADGDAAHTVALVQAIAVRAIIDWTGVGDIDGNVLPVSREGVLELMNQHKPYEAFSRDYVGPWFEVSAEKNVSAPSPDGGSAGAPLTAETAPTSALPAPGGNTSP